jgi:hypothetical protein
MNCFIRIELSFFKSHLQTPYYEILSSICFYVLINNLNRTKYAYEYCNSFS